MIIGHKQQLLKLDIILKNNMIPQTMLFSGIEGIGKKKVAYRFLSSLFCAGETRPCHACPPCRQVIQGTFPDLLVLAPDDKGKIPIGDSEKREQGSVRWLIERLGKKAVTGRFGVVIDGVDAISTEGQNALLKTIEEPPQGAVLILLASNRSRILPTILSRTSEVPFYPLTAAAVEEILRRENLEDERAPLIAALSGGSASLALRLADPLVLTPILALCAEIAAYVRTGALPSLDTAALQKQLGTETLLTVMVNVFRAIVVGMIDGSFREKGVHPLIRDLVVQDLEKLRKIIKILLALRKGLTNNLNFKYSLKGMLYSMDKLGNTGLPRLRSALEW